MLGLYNLNANVTEFSHQPKQYILYQNYPNPFNSVTLIKYMLPKSSIVSIKVYNILGEFVNALVNKKQPSGNYTVVWDGKDQNGIDVSSGLYFYTLKTNSTIESNKMILIR